MALEDLIRAQFWMLCLPASMWSARRGTFNASSVSVVPWESYPSLCHLQGRHALLTATSLLFVPPLVEARGFDALSTALAPLPATVFLAAGSLQSWLAVVF